MTDVLILALFLLPSGCSNRSEELLSPLTSMIGRPWAETRVALMHAGCREPSPGTLACAEAPAAGARILVTDASAGPQQTTSLVSAQLDLSGESITCEQLLEALRGRLSDQEKHAQGAEGFMNEQVRVNVECAGPSLAYVTAVEAWPFLRVGWQPSDSKVPPRVQDFMRTLARDTASKVVREADPQETERRGRTEAELEDELFQASAFRDARAVRQAEAKLARFRDEEEKKVAKEAEFGFIIFRERVSELAVANETFRNQLPSFAKLFNQERFLRAFKVAKIAESMKSRKDPTAVSRFPLGFSPRQDLGELAKYLTCPKELQSGVVVSSSYRCTLADDLVEELSGEEGDRPSTVFLSFADDRSGRLTFVGLQYSGFTSIEAAAARWSTLRSEAASVAGIQVSEPLKSPPLAAIASGQRFEETFGNFGSDDSWNAKVEWFDDGLESTLTLWVHGRRADDAPAEQADSSANPCRPGRDFGAWLRAIAQDCVEPADGCRLIAQTVDQEDLDPQELFDKRTVPAKWWEGDALDRILDGARIACARKR